MYKIKEIREKSGMTQDDLAEKSGISRSLISQLESGKLQSTSTKTLQKIALALDCQITNLFFEKEV